MNRRLIVCSDGTWQDLDNNHPTNVVKMTQAILPIGYDGLDQIIYYDEGVGSKQTNNRWTLLDLPDKYIGGALGAGIDHKIQDAYRFLCLNYQKGDEIFLFGFSRGAYTVRSLAGLIYNSGLPSREHVKKIPEAYELYRDRNPAKEPDGEDAINFRLRFGGQVPIKALCCWDTVAELGVPDLLPGINLDSKFNERYRFHDDKLNKTIEHAFHAVSIDESRREFYYTPMHVDFDQATELSQVWFPGGHGCVGGGSEKDRGLSDGALDWMLKKVTALGLSVDRTHISYENQYGEIVSGVHPDYSIPFEMAAHRLGKRLRDIPKTTNFSDEIDISVKERWKDPTCNYRPQNLQDQFQTELDEWLHSF
jgi:uncharacterized protein (DUF2235 family)